MDDVYSISRPILLDTLASAGFCALSPMQISASLGYVLLMKTSKSLSNTYKTNWGLSRGFNLINGLRYMIPDPRWNSDPNAWVLDLPARIQVHRSSCALIASRAILNGFEIQPDIEELKTAIRWTTNGAYGEDILRGLKKHYGIHSARLPMKWADVSESIRNGFPILFFSFGHVSVISGIHSSSRSVLVINECWKRQIQWRDLKAKINPDDPDSGCFQCWMKC